MTCSAQLVPLETSKSQNLQGRLPLHRRQPAPCDGKRIHQASVADDVRPQQRSARRQQSFLHGSGQRLVVRAVFPDHRYIRAKHQEIPQHQGRRGLQGLSGAARIGRENVCSLPMDNPNQPFRIRTISSRRRTGHKGPLWSIPAVAAAGPLPPRWIVFGTSEPSGQRPMNQIITRQFGRAARGCAVSVPVIPFGTRNPLKGTDGRSVRKS